ncbi:MAG: hypothetical protein KAW12_23065 [Candidatus Aminicenantes bacterium]|nr:hypothetical protein [Candidatus Aminicenantes bacterium]
MNPRYRKYIILTSIVLHVLLLIFWEAAIKLGIIAVDIIPPRAESAPIVFDLQPDNKPRQVIETPEDAKTIEKQKDADFLSDKNALARNPETDPEKEVGETFARGDFETHELPASRLPPGARPEKPRQQEKQQDKPTEADLERSAREVIKEYIEKQKEAVQPGVKERLPTVAHQNLDSRALDTGGGLSFNTYDWDFAPYMLALKKRIGRNIYPPPAFTRLGMIKGSTLLRFRIYPDGKMHGLRVLGYSGHKSLMQTSNTAIEISAPFPVLPANFPEPYLEVTCRFSYLVSGRR